MQNSRRQFLLSAVGTAAGAAIPSVRALHAESQAESQLPDSSPVASVKFLGSQFLENKVGLTGADGATSTVLPSGDSLWLFGDTVEGPFESIRKLELTNLRSNTAALVPQQDASQGIKNFQILSDEAGKRPRQIVPFASDENPAANRVWAIHGIAIARHIYLFYHRITLLKDVDVFMNFQLDGMGIARADLADLSFQRLTAPDGTRLFWKTQEPTLGVFVNRDADYVYLWGSLATGMHLARTRVGTIEDLASYEYLIEAPTLDRPGRIPRWDKVFQPTGMLFDSVPNEMSASFNPHLNKYIAFHSLHRDNKIVMRTAPQLTGPWSTPELVYRPALVADSDLIYAAKEHPELARKNGRALYVTYVNSASYIPQLIEVSLK